MDAKKQEIIEISSDDSDDTCCSWSTDSSGHGGLLTSREKFSANCAQASTICEPCISSTGVVGIDLSDDDDCVIVEMESDNVSPLFECEGFGDEMDELLIIHQKGEIPCRDYPHPRHLCATFPFNLTPHQKHCNMCHCYVCDSPAPCIYWDSYFSSSDHCHANNKEEMWKIERATFREKNKTVAIQKDASLLGEKTKIGCSNTIIRGNNYKQIRSVITSNRMISQHTPEPYRATSDISKRRFEDVQMEKTIRDFSDSQKVYERRKVKKSEHPSQGYKYKE